MSALGFARRRKDIHTVVKTLRDQGIVITGPFRRRNGTFIYSFADCIVTEGELLDLAKADKLDAAGVSELAFKIEQTTKLVSLSTHR